MVDVVGRIDALTAVPPPFVEVDVDERPAAVPTVATPPGGTARIRKRARGRRR